MPDKKLTDNEIKKALNECLSFEMFELRTGFKIDDVADLINRLTDKLNSAINGQEILQKHIVEQDKEIAMLRANIKLEGTIQEARDVLKDVDKHLKFEIQAVKAEAYKECIEKIKGELKDINKIECLDDDYYVLHTTFFDNLLKEMVGE